MMNRLNHLLMLLLLAVPAVSPLPAAGSGLGWSELSGQEQQLLKRFQDDWDQLPEERRHKLHKGAERWRQMTGAANVNHDLMETSFVLR